MLSPLAKAWGGSFFTKPKGEIHEKRNLKLSERCQTRDSEVCLAASLAKCACAHYIFYKTKRRNL